MSPTLTELRKISELVRAASQKVSDDKVIGYMNDFPQGWCGVTSRVLGAILVMNFPHEKVSYVNGNYSKDDCVHAWIEISGFILDLTADQFNDCDGPIIMPVPESTFHKQFTDQKYRKCYAQEIQYTPENIIFRTVRDLYSDMS